MDLQYCRPASQFAPQSRTPMAWDTTQKGRHEQTTRQARSRAGRNRNAHRELQSHSAKVRARARGIFRDDVAKRQAASARTLSFQSCNGIWFLALRAFRFQVDAVKTRTLNALLSEFAAQKKSGPLEPLFSLSRLKVMGTDGANHRSRDTSRTPGRRTGNAGRNRKDRHRP
jgi:hypothetical protein